MRGVGVELGPPEDEVFGVDASSSEDFAAAGVLGASLLGKRMPGAGSFGSLLLPRIDGDGSFAFPVVSGRPRVVIFFPLSTSFARVRFV